MITPSATFQRIQAYQGTQLIFDNKILEPDVFDEVVVSEKISISIIDSVFSVSNINIITVSEDITLTCQP
jgi:hypothetical protein